MSQNPEAVTFENGFFEFANEEKRKRYFGLSEKASNHKLALDAFRKAYIALRTPNCDIVRRYNDFQLENYIRYIEGNNVYKMVLGKVNDSFKFPNDFPNDFSNGDKTEYENLSNTLLKGISDFFEHDNQMSKDKLAFNSLAAETVKKYGKAICTNGRIAAQSMWHVRNAKGTDGMLMWSVCGRGEDGREQDVNYSNHLASITNRQCMAQIRHDLREKGLGDSTSPEGFDAISAFMALNAEGNVVIAAGPDLIKGNPLRKIELPILIRNPNVESISWLNTSPEFLDEFDKELISFNEQIDNLEKDLIPEKEKIYKCKFGEERNKAINNLNSYIEGEKKFIISYKNKKAREVAIKKLYRYYESKQKKL